jgi:hypothetical protein
LVPAKIELGEIPQDATEDMRRVAADMELLMGLFLGVGETRPLPYATKWCAERMGWGATRCMRACRAINALVRANVFRHAGTGSRRGGLDGCKYYEPGVKPLAAHRMVEVARESIEREPMLVEVLEGATIEPVVEFPGESMVPGAVAAGRVHAVGVAPGNGASASTDQTHGAQASAKFDGLGALARPHTIQPDVPLHDGASMNPQVTPEDEAQAEWDRIHAKFPSEPERGITEHDSYLVGEHAGHSRGSIPQRRVADYGDRF